MPRKPRRKTAIGPPSLGSTPAQRVTWLLDALWGGNRSAMAADIGVTHSVLAKIALGQQGPGRRLMDAIAEHEKVNAVWLNTGEGEPLLASRKKDVAQGWPVPIARQLLPGLLDDHRELLTDDFFPVAGTHYRNSRYWLRLLGDQPVTKTRRTSLDAGDLLLMETDPRYWRDPQAIHQHYCAVMLKGAKQPVLGLVNWNPGADNEPPALSCESFADDVQPATRKVLERITVDRYPNGRLEAHWRSYGDKDPDQSRPLHGPSIKLDQVVGIGVLLVRDF